MMSNSDSRGEIYNNKQLITQYSHIKIIYFPIFVIGIYTQKETDKGRKTEDFFLIPKCSPNHSRDLNILEI